jgi:phosphoribosylformylglycinamidine cyclo-ligase
MEERKYAVDIDLANQAKAEMASALESSDVRVMNKIGAFASLYDIRIPELEHPVLVMKTEEPGSKQLLAFQRDRVESICLDMVNHLINDCIVMGAAPLVVQDAVICGKLDKPVVKRIVAAISAACREQGCSLTGGETSEQPGVLAPGSYVLTSSIVGIVEKDNIIDGSKIALGDIVIGLESSGPHTNGYTLIRRLLADNPALAEADIDGLSFFDRVMEPHRCYYQGLKDLFPTGMLHGLAHITGGGIKENLDRILPAGLNARIDLGSYTVSKLWRRIRDEGKVSDDEMLRTFNMGVGLVAVAKAADAGEILGHLEARGFPARPIGEIVPGSGKVETVGKLHY